MFGEFKKLSEESQNKILDWLGKEDDVDIACRIVENDDSKRVIVAIIEIEDRENNLSGQIFEFSIIRLFRIGGELEISIDEENQIVLPLKEETSSRDLNRLAMGLLDISVNSINYGFKILR